MYKIYFNDRLIILTDDKKYSGQIYNYKGKSDMQKIIKDFNNDTKISKLTIYHDSLEELFEVFYSCFVIITAAGGLIKSIDGQILLIYRHNKWDLPKGKVDYNETFENAALREVKEETGIKSHSIVKRITDTYHTYSINNQLVLKQTSWFEMIIESPEKLVPQTIEGITEVKWFSPEDIYPLVSKMYPSVHDVLVNSGILKI